MEKEEASRLHKGNHHKDAKGVPAGVGGQRGGTFKAQREETREAGGHKARKADAELPTKLNQ